AYSGRVGIPAFRELGKVLVLRIETSASRSAAEAAESIASEAQALETHRHLSAGAYASSGGRAAERSETEPVWLRLPNGSACGRLEDTRRAKRLHASDGSELVSAHLSCFAFRTPESARALLEEAARMGSIVGLPAMFVSVPWDRRSEVTRALGGHRA